MNKIWRSHTRRINHVKTGVSLWLLKAFLETPVPATTAKRLIAWYSEFHRCLQCGGVLGRPLRPRHRRLIDGLMKLLSLGSVRRINVALRLMAALKSPPSERNEPLGMTERPHTQTHACRFGSTFPSLVWTGLALKTRWSQLLIGLRKTLTRSHSAVTLWQHAQLMSAEES